MLRFIARRFLETIPVLFVIVTLTFFMVRFTPGGPFVGEKSIPPEILKNIKAYYGYDLPVFQQYLRYMKNLVLQGDLGPSTKYAGWSAQELIAQSFPVSLELGCYGLAVALTIGLISGLIASLRQNSATDHAAMSLAMVGICVPTFVLGPLLILIFGLGLHWVNASGWDSAQHFGFEQLQCTKKQMRRQRRTWRIAHPDLAIQRNMSELGNDTLDVIGISARAATFLPLRL